MSAPGRKDDSWPSGAGAGRLGRLFRWRPTGPRMQQFLLGVAAGLTAQAIIGVWNWVRAPALRK
ncbi:MAG: hypothetical protein HY332_19080 [Chloroflexi bacterium]|nr:hypothetical protein [Chloroflexota bacterium]